MGDDTDVLLGFVLLGLAAVPVLVRWFTRRRRLVDALATGRVAEVPTDPALADRPSRPRTFELRLGRVESQQLWRPRGVDRLLGRNGMIVVADLAILGTLGWLAVRSGEAPAGWYAILGGAAVLPLVSAVLALRAMGGAPRGPGESAGRADVVAAWAGWAVLVLAGIVGWVALALVGLSLVFGSAG